MTVAMATPSQTEKGVRNISNAMILFMVFNAILIVFLFTLFPFIAQIATLDPTSPDPNVIESLAGTLLGFLAALCGALVVALIGLVMGLIGLVALRRGSAEFGPDHAQRLHRATIMLILGILIPLVGGFAVPTAAFGLGDIGDIVPTFNATAIAASAALGIIGTVLIGLFLLWAVESLSTPRERQLGLYALILGVAGVILGGVGSFVVLGTAPLPTSPQDFSTIFLLPGVVSSGISVVSIALWYTAYRGVLDRFHRLELRPLPPPAAPAPSPPTYPPGYWPPAQPVQPPPQPPQEPPKTPGT